MAFDYSNYSYDDLVAEITRLVQNKGEWTDAYDSSTGQVLIQLVAAITDNLHYMLERRTQESFMPTAQLQTSVNAIANILGYRPRRKVSSKGTLSLAVSPQNTDTIIIPKYSGLTFDGNSYVNTSDLTFLDTQTYPVTFEVKEGTSASFIVDSSDITTDLYKAGYITISDYLDIEDGSFYITTPTQTFTDVRERVGNAAPIDTLGFASSTDKVYDVVAVNEGLRIVFGDGINGEKPTGIVTVKYITSSGSSIEVLTTTNAFVFDDWTTQLVDESAALYSYTLSNTTTIVGGLEEETIDHIKKFAPNYVSNANRAVTKSDYIYWAKQAGIGSVVDANVYGEEELGVTVVNANNVYITYLTDTGVALTSTELTDLDAFIDNYKMITAQTIYTNATLIPLQIALKLKRSSALTASNSEVYDFSKNAMISLLDLQEGSLGKSIHHSDIVELFHNLTLTKNAIEYSVADYVTVDIKALYPVASPWLSTTDIDATFTAGTNGDVYEINVNDIPYTFTQIAVDAAADAQGLQNQLNLDLSVNSSIASNVLTLSRQTREISNNILFSEDFDNAVWVKTGTPVVTSNSDAAPDGNVTADTLDDNDGAASEYISQSTIVTADSNSKTVAIFIKKDGISSRYPALRMLFSGGTPVSTYVMFDTTDGSTLAAAGSTPTIVMEDWDDYWRFSVTIQNNSTNVNFSYEIHPAYRSTWTTGASDVAATGSIVLWGAQMDDKAVVGNYIQTREKPINLLFESSAIENRLLYSEEIDNAVWTKNGAAVTPDSDVDNDGATTIDTLTFTGGAGENIAQTITNIKSGSTYTTSLYAKQGTLVTAKYGVYDDTNSAWIVNPNGTGNDYTMTSSLASVTFSYTVPTTCESVTIYPAWQETSAGTMFIGQVQTRLSSSSTTYIPTFEIQRYFYDEGFTISNTGTTTPANIAINTPIQVPVSLLNNPDSVNLLLPSNVEIIQADGTVLFTDNGAGVISTGTVDYVTGVINIPILSDGEYFVRFLQNVDENFDSTQNQTFTYSLPKTNYSDTTELLSSIEVIS